MKAKILIKKTLMFSVLVLSMVVLTAGSGGGKGGKNNPERGKKSGGSSGCAVVEKEMNLVLYPNLPSPSIRNNTWAVPVSPSLWQGYTSATGIYDNPYSKYYCLVTVTTNCSNWGIDGSYNYVWNSIGADPATMSIKVPSNMSFRISIEYYEPCGPYWTGSNPYGRGKWYSEAEMNYQTSLHVTQWLFVKKENC